jgi:hypothetical protein
MSVGGMHLAVCLILLYSRVFDKVNDGQLFALSPSAYGEKAHSSEPQVHKIVPRGQRSYELCND